MPPKACSSYSLGIDLSKIRPCSHATYEILINNAYNKIQKYFLLIYLVLYVSSNCT